ncbi:hypothetical protein [Sinanaerobacter sp. ZZT-01]|uniref:hypothetical protein n=1 Tax=Sinanaerobacter sp. ZZT-01 TaxID=3111540 RepID=UPI002D787414|nr:hypothetical protein [Sinanaerobacter sp. ZZT-01]WRR94080.1 hypothetical protein U5921_02880 [Sinanaerobacter sp. ZZT-01]
MAKKTKNYNLTKPEPTDFYDVEVQNGNMDIIDEELKKANENAGDMSKSTYDKNGDGVVDNAEKINGKTDAQIMEESRKISSQLATDLGIGDTPNVEAAIGRVKTSLSDLQPKTDSALNASNKTVVGAINEIKELSTLSEETKALYGGVESVDEALQIAGGLVMADNVSYIQINLCYPDTNTPVPQQYGFTLSGTGVNFKFTTDGVSQNKTFFVPLGTYTLIQSVVPNMPFERTNKSFTLTLGTKILIVNAFGYVKDVFLRSSVSGSLDMGALSYFSNIQACVVGGGSSGQRGLGGGGGGYVTNVTYPISKIKTSYYRAVIGQGGAAGEGVRNGGGSSLDIGTNSITAPGGNGINGGSGGGGWLSNGEGGAGGSNGAGGSGKNAGKGQGTSTRIFGDSSMQASAGGGAGGAFNSDKTHTLGGDGGRKGGGAGGELNDGKEIGQGVGGKSATYYGSGGGSAGDNEWGYDRGQGAGYQGVVALRFNR